MFVNCKSSFPPFIICSFNSAKVGNLPPNFTAASYEFFHDNVPSVSYNFILKLGSHFGLCSTKIGFELGSTKFSISLFLFLLLLLGKYIQTTINTNPIILKIIVSIFLLLYTLFNKLLFTIDINILYVYYILYIYFIYFVFIIYI